MASLTLLCKIISLLLLSLSIPSPFGPKSILSENEPNPSFAFGWLDDKDTFMAGDIASIKVKVLGEYKRDKFKVAFNPNVTINGKIGNSSLISGVSLNFNDDPVDWKISFIPIKVGLFNILITDDNFNILDSSLHFQVSPGKMYPTACIVSWMDDMYEFAAGTKATYSILPQDAFGNNVTLHSEEANASNFSVFTSSENGSIASVLNLTYSGRNGAGFLIFEFVVALAGNFFLHLEDRNQSLNGSPLPFKVNPGALDVPSCVANWTIDTNYFQLFSNMEFFVHQLDPYKNLVPGLYDFDIEVIQQVTTLYMPIADLSSKEAEPGIQLFSFRLDEPGNFTLVISNKEQSNSISNMPYNFTVFVGYCDGTSSIVNGSGLNNSVAGEDSKFSILLKDAYQYPAPVDLEMLRVQIVRQSDKYYVQPNIYPLQANNGSLALEELYDSGVSYMKTDFAPSLGPSNKSAGYRKTRASSYEVTYTPLKSGTYEISIFCGNIQLNGGHPLRKEAISGEINMPHSGVVKFADKVPKMIRNEIIVQLMDSFSNPVLLQESKLEIESASANKSGFSTWPFVNGSDGLYTGFYIIKDAGNYEICVKFDGKPFHPCPFGVNVFDSEYFPKANNDSISVWEDESIAFDVMENDNFAGGKAKILEFSEPGHGSLLQYGQIFRYTPYKGYAGNDSFSYTVSDVNSNIASADVYISVLSIPPQFISSPSHLHAIEDVISPRFGGFTGIEIINSDVTANISVTLYARSGDVFLYPTPTQFWHPTWSELRVNKRDGKRKDLILEGRSEIINFALQSIQYLGNENFSGDDVIHITTMNNNGLNNLDVPISVEPVNDPPFIKAPNLIVLKKKHEEDGLMIFDREEDKFDFFIGDPDMPNYPGNRSNFMVIFSMEVNDGILSTKLPSKLIGTTELKLKNSYQWQPLQTFVTISHHFMVRSKGIRFRGAVDECNGIMQQLLYHGEDHSAVLTLKVSDMGNYGCYPDCSIKMSASLFAEANINLLRRPPMTSLAAHTLGTAIVIESVVVFSLGMVLLYFTCKCALGLVDEKRRHGSSQDIELSQMQSSGMRTPSKDLSESVTHFTGWCPSPSLNIQPSNSPKRSLSRSGRGQ